MHIAHFTNFYHPVINGVVRSVSAFRKALTELGHNVFIFAQQSPGYEDTEPFIFRYPAIKLPLQVNIPAAIPLSPFVDKLLPALKLDVIHTHHPVLLGQTAANKADELGLPLVFTFHTRYRDYTHYVPIPQDTVQEFVKNAVDSWLGEYMQKCHHIVVPSESMRALLENEYGLQDQVTVIPTGIDLRPYQQADGEKLRARRGWKDDTVLISVGRLAPEKNWATLLKAAALAMKSFPALRVVLIGDGPDRHNLEELSRELGIASRVEFVGQLPFDEIPIYLKAADLFGFASLTETQGLVTMEALAAGLPVAAVDATGTRDVVENGIEGLLTENDPQALATAILTLLGDDALFQRFRQAALQRARAFDILHLAQRLLEVYLQAREDQRAGRRVTVPRHKKLFKLPEVGLDTGPLKQVRDRIRPDKTKL